MATALNLKIAQVLETYDAFQYDKFTDDEGNPYPPGTIRIRFGDQMSGGVEDFAYPSNPNFMHVPLYGENVLVFTAPKGDSDQRNTSDVYWYINIINTQTLVNNSVLPTLYDSYVEGSAATPSPLVRPDAGEEVEQISWEEKDICHIQPFQGDILFPDRHGSVLRFSSTHLPGETGKYKEKPFFTGDVKNDPFISVTCGVDAAMAGGSQDKHFCIEDPQKDRSFMYLSSTQKFEKFELAQSNVGKEVEELSSYKKPQAIIGASRITFNAKEDELVLVSAKDVKVATPNWAMDMDEFFTEVKKLVDTCVKLAEGSYVYATPAGPTGPSSALGDLKAIQTKIDEMQQ